MSHTRKRAEYAVRPRYEEIPPDLAQIAQNRIGDSLAIAAFGIALPWSRMIAD